MTGRERCDEILRLIDQALAEVEVAGGTPPGGAPRGHPLSTPTGRSRATGRARPARSQLATTASTSL